MAKVRSTLFFLAMGLLFATDANAVIHTVGDAAGWSYGVDFEAWASRNPIYLGDYLMFYYLVGYHSVLLVSKQDYDTCTTSSPIAYDYSGATYVKPLTLGKTYIICGTPGLCERGMKLEINTLGYSSNYSPPPPVSYSRPPPPTPVSYSPPPTTPDLQSPPPPYFKSPPPTTPDLQSPPPPYLQSPPPPISYSESPPPPTSYSRSPPPPTSYAQSPPPPASNTRSPPSEPSPPPPELGPWQRSSAPKFISVGSIALTFALMMMAII